jgi:hypothetical protein
MKKQGIVNVTNMPLWAHKLTKPFELLVAELRIPHGQQLIRPCGICKIQVLPLGLDFGVWLSSPTVPFRNTPGRLMGSECLIV